MHASGYAEKKSERQLSSSSDRAPGFKAPVVSVAGATESQTIITEFVGSDIKTIIDRGFEEPVESSLPYMVVTRVQPMPNHAIWHIQGDCLVGGPGTGLSFSPAPLSFYRLQV
ncbi:unnamed protein product [Rhizoctonia solani]|uniref:Uncharacterized protein n=1 Tax=Rhizoctonia solani TaxID=456999 RepID=A0A8H3EDM8_9AGAM|nr:unnamed protein product [Rhizoctonia solani]